MESKNTMQEKNKGAVFLSLFDGMSCGQIALNNLGIKDYTYYASEIDKYAMQVTQRNFPDTIQLGDVAKVRGADLSKVDLLFGGSPCQSFSTAGRGLGFEGKSGLFWEFVRILEEVKPTYFLLENAVMKKEWASIITEALGVEPVKINSSLVSAQNRNRLYWTNIPGVQQPEDRRLCLADVWDGGEDITARVLSKPIGRATHVNCWRNMVTLKDKSKCLTAAGQGRAYQTPALLMSA